MVVWILNWRCKGHGWKNKSKHRNSFQIKFGSKHSIDGPKHREEKVSFQGSELYFRDSFFLLVLDLYFCFNLEKSNIFLSELLLIFKKKKSPCEILRHTRTQYALTRTQFLANGFCYPYLCFQNLLRIFFLLVKYHGILILKTFFSLFSSLD